jgi:hypothetical protein
MRVRLHVPAEGRQPLDEVDVPEDRGAWLVANGYAVELDGAGEIVPFDVAHETGVEASKDQTLAENREPANASYGRGDTEAAEEVVAEPPAATPKRRTKKADGDS